MNYDLCSGTCLKKSGIYSVAMFQKSRMQTRSGFFLIPSSRFLFPFSTLSSGFLEGRRKRESGIGRERGADMNSPPGISTVAIFQKARMLLHSGFFYLFPALPHAQDLTGETGIRYCIVKDNSISSSYTAPVSVKPLLLYTCSA